MAEEELSGKYVIVGTAGHIDHGKTELIKALTGVDTDRLKEEKERGITIDIGFASLELEQGLRVGFVDVPGHERFVKNMLAGAAGIDLVLLVVAANESVMLQTREHFEICRLLRVKKGLVAITKSDLVEDEIRELVKLEVAELLKGSFMEDAPIVGVSSKTGEGLEELVAGLRSLAAEVEAKDTSGVFRLPVDRSFVMRGFGTVVTGSLFSGEIGVEETVEILPSKLRARVRGLQVFNKSVRRAFAGQRTAINLQGISTAEVRRGDILTLPDLFLPGHMFDVQLTLLPTSPRPLVHLARVRFHLGTAEIMCRVHLLEGKRLLPGEETLAQLRLEKPTFALPGDRFIIRSYSPITTIGGGLIIDILPLKHKKRYSEKVLGALRTLTELDPRRTIPVFATDKGGAGMGEKEIVSRTGLKPEKVRGIVAEMEQKGLIHIISREPLLIISAEVAQELSESIISLLKGFHKTYPLRRGMPHKELQEKLLRRAPFSAFKWVMANLLAEQRLILEKEVLYLPEHQITLSPRESRMKEELESLYRKAGLTPPSWEEASQKLSGTPNLKSKILHLLLEQGTLVRLTEDLIFHQQSLNELKKSVYQKGTSGDRFSVGEFKEWFKITRKYGIPLLEYLDSEKVTRRVGDEREIIRKE
ncbi:selenocysteine-specific translation elongation factor [bacterium (candidate division B38) B3_B38]|nr:MAG: selenocysteine-specific translation elongation factor [bacterium (candidate division B38) B3_B38]